VIADLGAGGAQRVLIRATEILLARGYRVVVMTLADQSSDFYRLPPGTLRLCAGGVGVSANRMVGLWRNGARILALRRALRATGARSVLSFVTQTNVLTIMASCRLAMRVVVSERNDPRRQRLPWLWEKLRAWLYRHADAVTINSMDALAALKSSAPGTQPVFLPNPPPPIHPAVDAAQPARRVLNVGRLHPQKAQDVLIDAFALVARDHPGLDLCIAGEGEDLAALKALAADRCVAGRVDFVGTVKDIDAVYDTASIFALPSRHEGTPNALMEAMSHGLPCVVSDASAGLRDLIANEDDGLVVPADDPQALAQALDRLIRSPELRVRLGTAAHAKMRSRSAEAEVDRWEAILALGPARPGAV
jgi:glycosyltransferase involved in cell wall biosynthesis